MGAYANFYNSQNNDRKYDANSFEEWLMPFFSNGVFNGQLQVTAVSGMGISVSSGYAYINGKNKNFESSTPLTVQNAHSTLDRIDSVVVKRDDVARDFTIEIKTGTASANPTAPTPTRNSTTYEIVLAHIYVAAAAYEITQAAIIDTRMDSSICGWVASTVDEIDFEQITEQWAAFIASFEEENQDEFDAWFNEMKDQLSTDAAGHLQNEIDQLEESKQDALVSGTNIKTLNGQSILGSGDLLGITTGTLVAGSTSITITDDRLTTQKVILSFFTSELGVNPLDDPKPEIDTTNHTIKLYFDAQSADLDVGVRVEGTYQ